MKEIPCTRMQGIVYVYMLTILRWLKKTITTKTNKWNSRMMRSHCFNWDWLFMLLFFSLALSFSLNFFLLFLIQLQFSNMFNVFPSQLFKIFFHCCWHCDDDDDDDGDGGGCTDRIDDTHSMIWSQSNWIMLMILLFIVHNVRIAYVYYIKLSFIKYRFLLVDYVAFCIKNNNTSKVKYFQQQSSWNFKNTIFLNRNFCLLKCPLNFCTQKMKFPIDVLIYCFAKE